MASKELEAFTRISKGFFIEKNDLHIIANALEEYEQYKAIENEFGVDLIKFVNTFIKEDIYLKDKDGNVCCCDYEVTYNKDKDGWYFESCLLGKYYFKDYGKTWALTEEELEK